MILAIRKKPQESESIVDDRPPQKHGVVFDMKSRRPFKWTIFPVYLFSFILSSSVTAKTSDIPSWANKQIQLRETIKQCVAETQKWQNDDGSIYSYLPTYKWDDEVEIFYGWTIYYLLSGDESVYQSARGIALKYLSRAENDFDHGYYATPFFDTEHTLEGLNMLGALAFAKPSDSEVISRLEDLVEHVGNWVPGYAEWFDTNTKHLKSLRPGTREIDSGCDAGVDWVFNFDFAKLALAAYYATQNQRYLNWVGDYLDGWISSMERNARENGYYVLPSEVDPETGALGPCSGVWYIPGFQPGWGYQEKGNNANRDARGAFMDYFKITKDRKYLDAFKKHLRTLFENGSGNIPALLYDGTSWIAQSDKVTARMCIQADLFDPRQDSQFDHLLDNWNYRQEDYRMWDYRYNGDVGDIRAILDEAVRDANRTLSELQSLEALPDQADDFPKISEIAGLSLTAFGGVLATRGEMPWTEAKYYKTDGSLGLEDGVAALIKKGDDSVKVVLLSNTNSQDKIVKLQANFIPAELTHVTVDGQPVSDFQFNLATVTIPAGQTIEVGLYTFDQDTIPPLPPADVRLIAATEKSIHFQWSQPSAAEDNDTPRYYLIYRDGVRIGFQDSLNFIDDGLAEATEYRYRIVGVDKAGNESQPAAISFSTQNDTTPPEIESLIVADATSLQLVFSESLDKSSALNTDNYSITSGINVLSADLSATGEKVFLTTSAHAEGVDYSISIANIADDSKEHNIILPHDPIHYQYVSRLLVTNISKSNYTEKNNKVGDNLYSDREYKITEIPQSLSGFDWVLTANDDKTATGDNFLSFDINKRTTIYIAYDYEQVSANAVPQWLKQWEKTELVIRSDDTFFLCYRKEFPASTVTLGANYGDNSSSMYLLLIDPLRDLTPPSPPSGLSLTIGSN